MAGEPKPNTPAPPPAAPPPAPPAAPPPKETPQPLDEEAVRRIAQSEARKHVDPLLKWREGIDRRVQEFDATTEALRKSGAIKDEGAVAAARASLVADASKSEPPQPETTPAPSQTTQDPVYAEALAIAAKHGLQTGDPELAMIVYNQGARAYLNSVEEAGIARQKRAGGAPPPPPGSPEKPPIPSDLGLGGQPPKPNPIADITDPDVLLEQGLTPKQK